jgi:hypothetical protein
LGEPCSWDRARAVKRVRRMIGNMVLWAWVL